jgi:hypothetical protein
VQQKAKVAKTVNYFTKSSILSSCCTGRASSRTRNDALPAGSCLCDGIQNLEVAQRATGVIRLATLCAQSQKESWSWKGACLASEELVDLQAHPFFNLRDIPRPDPVLGMGDGFSVLYLLDVGVMPMFPFHSTH